jgi:hypothetical protein
MESEKLKRGNELQDQIKRVKQIRNQWEETTGLANKQIQLIVPPSNAYTWVPVSEQTFTIVRAVNLTHWSEVLAQLEKEFNEL